MSYRDYHKLKALVIDDFDNFRKTLMKMLETFGIQEIHSSASGRDIIRLCEDNDFDLILCDYNLGSGQNGQQILEELRYRNTLSRKTLFLIVSAESSRSIIMAAYDYEPDSYLTKPISGRSLQQRLDYLLKQRDIMLPIYEAIDNSENEFAIAHLNKQILANNRSSSLCQKVLGKLYLDMENWDSARVVYNEVLEERELEWAKIGMARVLAAKNDSETAKKMLQDILENNPFCMQAYDVLADIYSKGGEIEALANILQDAVLQSPIAILRQEKLANVAKEINDIETAALAFRQTVKLGKNSCHNKIENHLNFGRAASSLAQQQKDVDEMIPQEAFQTLKNIGKVFKLDDSSSLKTILVKTQLFAATGDQNAAGELLESVQEDLDDIQLSGDIETHLDLVAAFRAMRKNEKADTLLQALVENYQGDETTLQKIDPYLDEPVSNRNVAKVSVINKEGIGHYEQRRFSEAVNCFASAERMFPRHLGIKLNYVQAIEGALSSGIVGDVLLGNAQTALEKVKKNISNEHDEYSRFLQLQEMLRARAHA